MNEADAYRLDKRQVRVAFERAAAGYDQVAVLQHEVNNRLLERLELVRMNPQVVLDLGTGTGAAIRPLRKRYHHAQVIGLDLAPAMLLQARRHSPWWRRPVYVCGDIDQLPFPDACADMVFSNLALQWSNDLEAVFREFRRVLRPEGMLLFTTFGPDTLKELRSCWREVDHHTHVHAFIDMHDIGDAMLRAGLVEPVMDMELFTLTYPDLPALMHELKSMGAHNVAAGRPRGLTGKGHMQHVQQAYERLRADGHLPATFEVVYGHAWLGTKPAPVSTGDVHVPLAALQRKRSPS